MEELDDLDAQVYGLSLDDVNSQAKFHEAQELNFPLLSDPDGSVAGKYDAAMGGRPFAKRITFVIDDEGVLRHIDTKVNVKSHGGDLVELVSRLQAEG